MQALPPFLLPTCLPSYLPPACNKHISSNSCNHHLVYLVTVLDSERNDVHLNTDILQVYTPTVYFRFSLKTSAIHNTTDENSANRIGWESWLVFFIRNNSGWFFRHSLSTHTHTQGPVALLFDTSIHRNLANTPSPVTAYGRLPLCVLTPPQAHNHITQLTTWVFRLS